MLGAIGRSLAAAIAMSLWLVTASYAMPAVDAPTTAGKPLVLVNSAKSKHPSKKSARLHRNERTAAKSNKSAGKTTENASAQPARVNSEVSDGHSNSVAAAALPPEIANAHAELTAGETKSNAPSSTLTEADKAAGTQTDNSGVQIAPADQLNDIDRDLAAQTSPAPAGVQTASLSEDQNAGGQYLTGGESTAHGVAGQNPAGQDANRVALIGKILIGLGALMTLASAARMLIA